jgi:hypothetical protein
VNFDVIVEPRLSGGCELVGGVQVNCRTSLDDHMVTLTYKCSYLTVDTGQIVDLPSSCMFLIRHSTKLCNSCILIGGPNFTINRENFTPGRHLLTVTVTVERDQPFTRLTQLVFQGNCMRL